jgi:homoserine kinase
VAAVVSGAGATVLALTPVPEAFQPGIDWDVQRLEIQVPGARVEGGTLGHAERGTVAAGRKS